MREVAPDELVHPPEALLARYGVCLEDLRAGRITPGYRDLMAHLEAQARALYRTGLKGLPRLRVGKAAIALAALQYQGILDKLKRMGYQNLSRRAHLKPWERLWLLPEAYRLARTGE